MFTNFTKKDLKTGMVVATAGEEKYMVIAGCVPTPCGTSSGVFISADDWMSFDEYDDRLISKHSNSALNIDIVYESSIFGLDDMLADADDVIWERGGKSVDWNTISVDTLILVRNYDDEDWIPAYFAEYVDDSIYVWADGTTSITAIDKESWCHAKLYEEDK